MAPHDHTSIKECIEACWKCRATCQETFFKTCLPQGGKHIEGRHVKLMIDCIEMCQTAADFMTRGSELHQSVCLVCADICEACAASCKGVGGKEMDACAEACLRCAQTCREMGKMDMAA